MATIEKRGKRWRAKVRRQGFEPYTATFDTKPEAEEWGRIVEGQLGYGDIPARVLADQLSLDDALQRYSDEISPKKKSAKVEAYRIKAWRAHPFAKRSLTGLRPSDFANYRDDRLEDGAAPSTVRLELALVSNVYTVCIKQWHLEGISNPLASVVMPKPGKGRERRLMPGEEERLMKACAQVDPMLPRIVVWALETGMRRGEIAKLKTDLVRADQCTATVEDPKNGETRTVPLSTRAIAVIPEEQTETLFNVTDEAISRSFAEARELAGIEDLRFHDLRHEATSRLFELGTFTVFEVAMITGHKDLKTLKRYTHLSARNLVSRLG